jgi:hypothetical protein
MNGGAEQEVVGWVPFACGERGAGASPGRAPGIGGAVALLGIEACAFHQQSATLFRLWNGAEELCTFVDADAFLTRDNPPPFPLVTGAIFLGNEHEEAPIVRLVRFVPKTAEVLADEQESLAPIDGKTFGERLDRAFGRALGIAPFRAFAGLSEEEFAELAAATRYRIAGRNPDLSFAEPRIDAAHIAFERFLADRDEDDVENLAWPFVDALHASLLVHALEVGSPAAAAIERSLRGRPRARTSAAPLAALAQAAEARGDAATADADAVAFLALRPEDAGIHALRVNLARAGGHLEEAAARLAEGYAAVTEPRLQVPLFFAEAALADSRNEPARAIAALRKLLAAFADDPERAAAARRQLASYAPKDDALAEELVTLAEGSDDDPRLAGALAEGLATASEAQPNLLPFAIRALRVHVRHFPTDLLAWRSIGTLVLRVADGPVRSRPPANSLAAASRETAGPLPDGRLSTDQRALLEEVLAAHAGCTDLADRARLHRFHCALQVPKLFPRIDRLFDTVDDAPTNVRAARAWEEISALEAALPSYVPYFAEKQFRILALFGHPVAANKLFGQILDVAAAGGKPAAGVSANTLLDGALLALDDGDRPLAKRLRSFLADSATRETDGDGDPTCSTVPTSSDPATLVRAAAAMVDDWLASRRVEARKAAAQCIALAPALADHGVFAAIAEGRQPPNAFPRPVKKTLFNQGLPKHLGPMLFIALAIARAMASGCNGSEATKTSPTTHEQRR